MKQLIAIVEDEPDILKLVAHSLEKAGYEVQSCSTGEQLLSAIKSKTPDLFILDLMLPDWDGFDLCREIRGKKEMKHTPIIMLTARTQESDRILGLELGADDYVTKPFFPRELVARVRARLRRIPEKKKKIPSITIGVMRINLEQHLVDVENEEIQLTSSEYRILELLTQKPGNVYGRDEMLEYLWGEEKVVIGRTIDVHINHLRKKLKSAGTYIKNIRGFGYKIEV